MTLTTIVALVALLSYLSIKTEFILLKITAMAMWFVLFIYIKDSPPDPFVAGSTGQQMIMMVCIAAGVGVALMAFGRNVNKNRGNSNNSVSGTSWGWKFGKDKDEYEGRVKIDEMSSLRRVS
jgi:hypothetical protein